MAIHYDRLGKNLQKYRKKNRLSQNVLAEKINCPHTSISRFENNKRKLSLELLNSICEELDISYEEILAGATDAKVLSGEVRNEENWAAEEFIRITAGCSDEAVRKLLDICNQIISMPKR